MSKERNKTRCPWSKHFLPWSDHPESPIPTLTPIPTSGKLSSPKKTSWEFTWIVTHPYTTSTGSSPMPRCHKFQQLPASKNFASFETANGNVKKAKRKIADFRNKGPSARSACEVAVARRHPSWSRLAPAPAVGWISKTGRLNQKRQPSSGWHCELESPERCRRLHAESRDPGEMLTDHKKWFCELLLVATRVIDGKCQN